MIRRALMLVAAAALLVLTPSVAMAYEAPGFTSTVSDATPAVGQCVTMTVNGGNANAGKVFTLTATGPSTTSLTATATAAGVASFQFCPTAVGDYTLTVTNPAGAVVATQTVSVHATTAAGDDTSTPGKLSQTGSNVMAIGIGGVLLVLLGAGAVVVARRHREPAMHD